MTQFHIPPLHAPNKSKIETAVVVPIKNINHKKMSTYDELVQRAGDKPKNFIKPLYGEVDYWLCHKFGWITDEEVLEDEQKAKKRSHRSLTTSHRFALRERRYQSFRKTSKYVPETTLNFNLDLNLTPSAKAVMALLLSEAYCYNRKERWVGITVNYIQAITTFSRRTVQRALELLETQKYITAEVCKPKASKMCYGLFIQIKSKILPRHHKRKWPEKRKNSGAPRLTQKESLYTNIKRTIQGKDNSEHISRKLWAVRCMEGVYKAFQNKSMSNSMLPYDNHLVKMGL